MDLLQEFPTNMEPAVSKRISDVLLRRNGVAGGNGAPAYNPVPRSPPLLGFPVNQTTVVNLPLGSIPGISSITTKGSFQEEVTSGNKGSFGPISSINGIDLRTLAVAGQLPAQSLATFQAAGFGDRQHKASDDADYSSLANEGNSMFCASLASICHALRGFKM